MASKTSTKKATQNNLTIHLLRSTRVKKNVLDDVYDTFKKFERSYFGIHKHNTTVTFHAEAKLSITEIFANCREWRKDHSIPDGDIVLLLMSEENKNYWTGLPNPSLTPEAFVNTYGWSTYVPNCSPKECITYYLVVCIIQHLIFDSYQQGKKICIKEHGSPRGCINDFCKNLSDITFKMRTGDICRDCVRLFEKRITNPRLKKHFRMILEAMRHNFLYDKRITDSTIKTKIPFPIAYQKARFAQEQSGEQKFKLSLLRYDLTIRMVAIILDSFYTTPELLSPIAKKTNGSTKYLTMGDWLDVIHQLLSKNNARKSRLPPALFKSIEEMFKIVQMRNVVNQRNKHAHDYVLFQPNDLIGQAKDIVRHCEEIEEYLFPVFKQFECYYVRQTIKEEDQMWYANCIDLSGDSKDLQEISFKLTGDIPETAKVYFRDTKTNAWHSAGGLLKYDTLGTKNDNSNRVVQIIDGKGYFNTIEGCRLT